MPGHIESVPFLSQLEDVDKYLLEYRNLKQMSQATKGFTSMNTPQGHQQMRFQSGNETNNGLENEAIDYVKGANRIMQLGGYGNMVNKSNSNNNNNNNNTNGTPNNNNGGNGNNIKNANGSNGGVSMNRKKFSNMNMNQGYRFNNASNLKYGPQKQQQSTQFNHNPMMTSHFKQAYPQVYYNSSNSGSNISLDQLNTPFYGSNQALPQQHVSSGNSSPSLALPKLDTPLSGTSSISSYNGSFDQIVPTTSEYNNQFSSTGGTFSNYLSGGMINTGSVSVTSGSANNTDATISSSRNDLLTGFPSGTLANEAVANRTGALGMDQNLTAQGVLPDPIISHSIANGVQDNSISNGESSTTASNGNASNQFLMSDFSVGWGSNHANVSSSNSSSFGIWNNDMSVWS